MKDRKVSYKMSTIKTSKDVNFLSGSPLASHDMEFCTSTYIRYLARLWHLVGSNKCWELKHLLLNYGDRKAVWIICQYLSSMEAVFLEFNPPLTFPRQEKVKKSRWEREEKGRKMYLLPFNDKCELYVGNNVLMLLDSSCTTLCSIRISVCIISMRKDLSFCNFDRFVFESWFQHFLAGRRVPA